MRHLAVLLMLTLVATACDGEDTGSDLVGPDSPATSPAATADPTATPLPVPSTTSVEDPPPDITGAPAAQISLTATGLPEGSYTLAVDTAAGPGAATVPFDGTTVTLDGVDPGSITALSLHAGGDTTGVALLSGSVDDQAATMTADLPVDLTDASDQYILATPTDGADSDETSGVWYLLIPRAPGLVLPILEDGWVYEGWVTVDGVDLTTGRFGDPAGPEDFDGFSGDQPGPPLPGEDFLVGAPPGVGFPVDLSGATTFVTLEPADDPDPRPSGLTVLSAQIPAPALDHTIYDMTDVTDTLPTVAVTIS